MPRILGEGDAAKEGGVQPALEHNQVHVVAIPVGADEFGCGGNPLVILGALAVCDGLRDGYPPRRLEIDQNRDTAVIVEAPRIGEIHLFRSRPDKPRDDRMREKLHRRNPQDQQSCHGEGAPVSAIVDESEQQNSRQSEGEQQRRCPFEMQHFKKLRQVSDVDDAQNVSVGDEVDIAGDIGHHQRQRSNNGRQFSPPQREAEGPVKRKQQGHLSTELGMKRQ